MNSEETAIDIGGDEAEDEPQRDFSLIAIRFREHVPKSAWAALSQKLGPQQYSERVEIPGEKLTLFAVTTGSGEPQRSWQRVRQRILAHEIVEYVRPVYVYPGGLITTADRLVVALKDEHGFKDTSDAITGLNCEILERVDGQMLVSSPPGQALETTARRLKQLAGVTRVDPDFIYLSDDAAVASPTSTAATGTASQYALLRTRAIEAWQKTRGKRNVRIALLDTGIASNHPDLSPAIVSEYDAIDGDSIQEPYEWDWHGTACAGLAVGQHRSRSGIAGVGRGCGLVAVRVKKSPRPNRRPVLTVFNAVRGIDWAWRQGGSSIISLSWYLRGGPGINLRPVTYALLRAMNDGRNGLGCVVVAAAGNRPGNVVFPANVRGVITVSATDPNDNFKVVSAGEPWGSAYGPQVDVAAPGVALLTTDIPGRSRYDRSPGGNYRGFDGTSASAPLVAGTAGLILSANPMLPRTVVGEIIRRTADKTPRLAFPNGRNIYVGFGRVNALKAVIMAHRMIRRTS